MLKIGKLTGNPQSVKEILGINIIHHKNARWVLLSKLVYWAIIYTRLLLKYIRKVGKVNWLHKSLESAIIIKNLPLLIEIWLNLIF